MSAVVCIEDCRTRPYMDPALWSTDSHLDVDLLVRGFHGSVAICKSPRRGFQNYWSTVTKTTCVFVCVLLSSMKTKGLLVLPNQRLWSDPALPANKNSPASGRAIQAVISRACQSRGDGIARRGGRWHRHVTGLDTVQTFSASGDICQECEPSMPLCPPPLSSIPQSSLDAVQQRP